MDADAYVFILITLGEQGPIKNSILLCQKVLSRHQFSQQRKIMQMQRCAGVCLTQHLANGTVPNLALDVQLCIRNHRAAQTLKYIKAAAPDRGCVHIPVQLQ